MISHPLSLNSIALFWLATLVASPVEPQPSKLLAPPGEYCSDNVVLPPITEQEAETWQRRRRANGRLLR